MKLNRQEFLSVCGLGHETLSIWLEEQWLIPGGEAAEPSFSDIDVARARLIKDLKEDLGVNDAGIGVILDLVDQLHGMRRTLGALRHAAGSKAE